MALAPVSKSYNTGPTGTSNIIQQYAVIMNNLLVNNFPLLNSAGPDVLFIMMATMGCESSYRLLFGNPGTPNHVFVGFNSGFGKSYWQSPVIQSYVRANPNYDVSVMNEGASAKSLMGSMGSYQIRGTVHYNELAANKTWLGLMETNGIAVNPGTAPSSVFLDAAGPTRSMIMGCIIMESKYRVLVGKKRSNTDALYLALQYYVGGPGAVGILRESGEGRLAQISSPNDSSVKKLAALGITRTGSTLTVATQADQSIQYAVNTATVGTTNNISIPQSGCSA